MFTAIRLHTFSHKKVFLNASSLVLNNKIHTQLILNRGQTEVFKKIQKIRNNLEYQNLTSPEYFNFAGDIIDSWASVDEKIEDKPCAFWFVFNNGEQIKWTYQQLSNNSQKAANCLVQLGAGSKWKKCLLVLPKMPDWWLINLACMRLGTPIVQSSSMVTAKDIQYRIQKSKVSCVITTPRLADAVDSIASTCPELNTKILVDKENKNNYRPGWLNYREVFTNASEEHECVKTKGSDIFQIYFTSGTTSLPKCVLHTHAGLSLSFLCISKSSLQLDRRVVFWNIADTGWAKTFWSCIASPWLSGATAFVHEMPQFNPKQTIEILQNYPVQRLCAPPTVYRMLLAQNIPQFNSLKVCFSAGESLSAEVWKKWKEFTNISIIEGYGQTETPALIIGRQDIPFKMGFIGKANPALKIALLDNNGKEVSVGTNGQIALKCKPNWPLGLFLGYEGDVEKTSKVFAGDYYLTGDMAYIDADGYFRYNCRTDDVITSSGYRIGPFEVESVLQEHPDVLESAVIGIPDYKRTQIVKAFVVLRDSGRMKDPEKLKIELQDHVKKTTAPYKYPRKIEFIDALPKTTSQKIRRADLRAAEENKLKTNPVKKK